MHDFAELSDGEITLRLAEIRPANPEKDLLPSLRYAIHLCESSQQVGKIDLQFAATDAWKFKFGVDYKKYDFVSFESRRASETTVPVLPTGTTVADLSTTISGL